MEVNQALVKLYLLIQLHGYHSSDQE